MFESIFADATTTASASLSLLPFLEGVFAALVLGVVLAAIYSFRSRYTRSFLMTLATLPAIVAVVIMMVNGNVGAGVAVAGAFSLVRFRSVPGSARDIAFIFLAMCVGLVCGMGYIAYAVLVTLILGGAFLLLQAADFGGSRSRRDRTVRITVPEDLDYSGLFSDVFVRHTTYHELVSVKTTNMGSLYRLVYNVGLKDAEMEKAFIDDIRVRNGNLEVSLTNQEVHTDEL